jgi:DNA-binding transcriptional MerR regulator
MAQSGEPGGERRGGVTSTATHRSIGEVLALLKDEFPDVTISKIRFLESQGLIDPERTPSGYRRFYDKDVERLRWILRQQREHFLPLKVIKDRLAEGLDLEPEVEAPGPEAEVEPAAPASEGGARRRLPEPALFAQRPEGGADGGAPPRGPAGSAMSLTTDELAAASGLSTGAIAELERFGLIEHRFVGSTVVYDEDALLVAGLAAGFLAHGVEPRHLRMYKVGADREAGIFEQIVMPLARQRRPDARRRVVDTLADLSRLGESLHAAMVRHALKNLT